MRCLTNLLADRMLPDTLRLQSTIVDFFVELLEQRQLLAGLVTVNVSNAGDITITGDQQGNEIELNIAAGDLEITGVAGTLISLNGVVAGQQLIDLGVDEAVDRDLILKMRGGEDQLSLTNVVISRHLNVNLGRGDDGFVSEATTVQGQTTVFGGGGRFRDLVGFSVDTILDESVFVSLGANRNGLEELATFSFATMNDQVTVIGGRGAQRVSFGDSLLNGPITAKTGAGNDRVNVSLATLNQPFFANLGSGDDEVLLNNLTVAAAFDCRLGGGDDRFTLEQTAIEESTFFHGGAGTDRAVIAFGNTFTVPVSMASVEEVESM